MKKLLFVSLFGLFTLTSIAQGVVDKAMLDQAKKDKEASDKSILDEKKKSKPQTWLDRGKLYDQIGQRYVSLDSNAAMEAYSSFKKAIELDAAKPTKATKDAQKYLTGGGADEGVNLRASVIQTGAAKFQAKKYVDAIQLFKIAQEIDPKDTLAPLYAGYAALQAQKNDIAAEEMEKYINSGGKDAGNFALLAQLYRQEKKGDKALSVLDRGMVALPMNKNSFKAERVNILLDAGKTEEALAGLKELTELEPNNAQYALNMGILHDNIMTNIGADIRKLSESGRKVTNAENRLKSSEQSAKDFVDELKRIGDGIKKQPKNPDFKRQKADVEARMKENATTIAEGKAEVEKVKAEVATLGDVNAKIAELTIKKAERRELARNAYQLALKADPKNYDALFNLGVFFYNEAVEMKAGVDVMDMKEYETKGKALESKVCGKFKQSQPYFDRAKVIKTDDEPLVQAMLALTNALKQYEEKKIVCEEAK